MRGWPRLASWCLSTWILTAFVLLPAAVGSDLAHKIDRILDHPNLRGAKVGLSVISLREGGGVLYERGDEVPLIPASNAKLITSAAALAFLGPAWDFRTRIGWRGTPDDEGGLDGDLILIGGGDPLSSDERMGEDPARALDRLVAAVRQKNVTRVRGALLVDASVFDDDYLPDGWPENQLDRTYCAPVSGLSFNTNLIRVLCNTDRAPGGRALAELWPPGSPLRLDNSVSLVSGRGVNAISLLRPDSQGLVRARGKSSAGAGLGVYEVPMRKPTAFVAGLVLNRLREAGVTVDEGWREHRIDLDDSVTVVAEHRTPLVDLLALMNKDSDNSVSEHVFKAIAAKRFGLGSYDGGSRAIDHFLWSVGAGGEGGLVDGSGLSRGNRISARGMTQVLSWMYRSAYRDAYVGSLAVAGVDGTLDDRMTGERTRKKVRAKSGYIRAVSALSGYVKARGGVLAFSILINDFRGSNSHMKRIQNEIGAVLADVAD